MARDDKSQETTFCRLCCESKKLCRSHVVPEFAYEPLRNEKRQIHSMGRKNKIVQTGYFERLLCADCETILSKYESAFKKYWMDTIPSDFRDLIDDHDSDSIVVQVPDFDIFKLFHLSVFWRAAVSRKFRIGEIDFGRYGPVIADMLLAGKAGDVGDFPIIGILNVNNQMQPVSMITQIVQGEGRFDNCHYYMMSYAYCDWILLVSKQAPEWLATFERMCRFERTFTLLTSDHANSQSAKLWKRIEKIIRQ